MPSPMRRTAAALALALLLPLPSLAGEVVVKPGETLSEIAERYGTSVERLMQLNGLRSAKDLWAGSRIQVPGAGGGSNARGGGGASSGSGNYTVKPGETLSEIAERHGTSVDRLMQLNNLRSAKDLWAGSRIQVPGASPVALASSWTTPGVIPSAGRAFSHAASLEAFQSSCWRPLPTPMRARCVGCVPSTTRLMAGGSTTSAVSTCRMITRSVIAWVTSAGGVAESVTPTVN